MRECFTKLRRLSTASAYLTAIIRKLPELGLSTHSIRYPETADINRIGTDERNPNSYDSA